MDGEARVNLLDYDREALTSLIQSWGGSSHAANKLFKWIHFHGITDVSEIPEFNRELCGKLKAQTQIKPPQVHYHHHARDGTQKWICQLSCGNSVETVYIPEVSRGTLCISSQVGCALKCSFCSTGTQGFNRNLSVSEIIGQLWIAVRALSQNGGMHDRAITNVVFMGMGEPLLNFIPVMHAVNIMLDHYGYGLSKYRVTISTSGIVPAMKKLAIISDVALAVSLHAPNDTLRDVLVPINKKYPLAKLLPVCRDFYGDKASRSITMEYVMLDQINDTPECAHQLIKVLQGIPSKVNLIPFNPFPGTGYRTSSADRIQAFSEILSNSGLVVTTRKTRGEDITAACGQLVGEVRERKLRVTSIRTGSLSDERP